ncbi:hypothetical protein SCHPADRAFT_905435 [Schizopora paradoxa]|uniref:DUF6533 domain-containing protein n=1 Tax=Schizopora paradoxa TaxID=27342 RepID=A0A0H2RKC6_9AGAM|nr:hypothetical protein SCHPADRAFT_905435 [Schizopora paradoxa]
MPTLTFVSVLRPPRAANSCPSIQLTVLQTKPRRGELISHRWYMPVELLGSSYELTSLVRYQSISKYTSIASAVVLLHETFVNFADEVDLIWRQRLTVGKVLYLTSRYLAFIDLSIMLLYLCDPRLELKTCHRLYVTTIYFTLVGAVNAELVLIIRVYAIWKQSFCILIFLVTLSSVLIITNLLNFNIHNSLKTLTFVPSPVPVIIPCFLTSDDIRAFVGFGCLVLMDLIVLILTAWCGYRFWREDASSPLITTFYRDGVLYFVCLFAISTANVVMFIVGDPQQQGILVELQRVLHSVLSARIILNLRKFAVANEEESPVNVTLTTAIFGELLSDSSPFTAHSTRPVLDEDGAGNLDLLPTSHGAV